MKKFLSFALLFFITITLVYPMSGALAETASSSYTINASSRVTDEDWTYVEEGIRLGQRYLKTELDVELEDPLIVNIRATSAPTNSAEVGESALDYITIFTRSHGWYASPPFRRIGTVIHEYVHVYQMDQLGDDLASAPAWIIEGSAEYLATDALVKQGLISQSIADDFNLWLLAEGPTLGDLEAYESLVDFQQEGAQIYGLAYLGVEHLAAEYGVQSIAEFFRHMSLGQPWQKAFALAFEVDPAAFYEDFGDERTDFLLPTNPPRAYDELKPQELAAPVRSVEAPLTTSSGDQFVLSARSIANARCIIYLSGDTLDLTRETTVDGAGNLFWIVTIPEDTPAQLVEFSIDCGGGEALGSVEVLIENSGSHQIIRDES